MTTPETPNPMALPVADRRVRVIRYVGLVLALLLGAPFAFLIYDQGRNSAPFYAIMALLLVWPFLTPGVRLWFGQERTGARAAIGTGAAGLVIAGLLAVVILAVAISEGIRRSDIWPLLGLTAGYAGVACLNGVLLLNGVRLNKERFPQEGGKKLWVMLGAVKFVYFLVVVMFLGAILPSTLRSRTAANESSAAGSLRTLSTTAQMYVESYKNGFPHSLDAMGPATPPTCAAADLIDFVLAGGMKSGYRFEYQPGPPVEKPAAGCPPGVQSYRITARPLTFGTTGYRSFFTDESRVIRHTKEDRAATAADPPID